MGTSFLVQKLDITQSSIQMFHLFCDTQKAVFSFSHYEFNLTYPAFTAHWQPTLNTSWLEVTTQSRFQRVAQWSGSSRAEEKEELRRGRSKDTELLQGTSGEIIHSGSFYKLPNQPLEILAYPKVLC